MSKIIDYLTVLPTDSLGGGAEQLLFNVFEYHISAGEQCLIIFLSKQNSKKWNILKNKARIIYLPFKNVYLGYIFIFPLLIYISLRYRIKHSFTSQTLINSLFGFLKKIGILKKTMVIVRESNSIFHLLHGNKLKMYSLAYKIGYPGVDLVICQTEFMKAELLKEAVWMNKKLKVIVLNNPVNMNLMIEKGNIIIKDLPKDKYIIAAGRLSPVKGFDILIKSFKIFLREFPNLKLYILGTGNEYDSLNKLIKSENLEDKIKLIGFVDNVYPYFKNAELCVMSSRIEGFPNVLLQMMSQNTKVVSTKSAGGIDNIQGVYTCEINDIEGLALTMQKCIEEETNINRELFDTILSERTITNFTSDILKNVDV